jgi:large subunit ribosomal protein L29
MRAKELREKSVSDLHRQLASWREKLRDLNFRIANKQVKNFREHKKIRQEIARVITVLHEKRLSSQIK